MTPKIFVPSKKFIRRLRDSYCRAIYDENDHSGSVLWSNIIPKKQANIHQALLESDDDCLSLFSDMLSHDLYYGVDNHCLSIWGGLSPSKQIHFNQEDLIKLATSIGLIDVWNPVGGSKNPNCEKPHFPDDTQILEMLDKFFSFPVTFPNPFTSFASESKRGIGSNRSIQAIYQAYRMCQISKSLGIGLRFLEIGGGMGRTVFYAHKFGVTDFTVIDIPLGMVRQACFLGATLGEDAIWLFGEPPSLSDEMIKIAPPAYLFTIHKTFDITLNADSFTEMSLEDAKKYIDFLRTSSRILISINHEANDFRVRDLWPGMWRHPYPLREGYVEEIGLNFT